MGRLDVERPPRCRVELLDRLAEGVGHLAGEVRADHLAAVGEGRVGDRHLQRAGLHDAATAPGGTSYEVFGGYPVEIAGKTGTAERPPNPDQSWYVALAPYDDPKYVVAVTVEGGGFGADTAAPITREILSTYLNIDEKKIKDVEGATNAE